jgi:hypothetical protein
VHNVLWYGVVREFEAISYQYTLPFFLRAKNARKPLKPACTIPCVGRSFLIINNISFKSYQRAKLYCYYACNCTLTSTFIILKYFTYFLPDHLNTLQIFPFHANEHYHNGTMASHQIEFSDNQ